MDSIYLMLTCPLQYKEKQSEFTANKNIRPLFDKKPTMLPTKEINMVVLTGYIIVPDSDLPAVMGELDNHIQLTRQEHGCQQFEVTQSRLNPCRFEVCETFSDPAAFAAHQARVKASRWGEITVNVERHYTVTGLGE